MLETLSRETLVVPDGASALLAAQHRVAVQRGRSPQPALRRHQPPAAGLVERSPSWPALAVRPTPAARPAPVVTRRPGNAPDRRAALRITRRGRLMLLLVVAALLFVAFSIGRVMSNADSAPPAAPATHTVVVAPGDTAWSIARAAMPKLDGRDAVDRLLALNHSDGRLQVGQTLVVPGS